MAKGLQLKYLWREAAPRLDFVDTERMNAYILQVHVDPTVSLLLAKVILR